ncbi:MAG: sensor histidine kinase [Ruminococcus sp.]
MNSIFPIVFDILIDLLQNFVIVLFTYKFLNSKFTKGKDLLFGILAVLAMTVTVIVVNYFNVIYQFTEIIAFLSIMYIYIFLCLKGNIIVKLVLPIIECLLLLLTSLIYTFFANSILNVDTNQLMYTKSNYGFVVTILVNFTYILILLFVYRVFKDKFIKYNFLEHILFLLFPIMAIPLGLILFSIANDSNLNNDSLGLLGILSVVIFVLIISLLLIMSKISKNRELLLENTLMKQKQEMYQNEIKNADSYISEIAKIKHDIKNQVLCIGEMITNNKYNEAIEYCNSIKSDIENTNSVINTDNIYLNSIINVINKKAKANNIDLKINIESTLNEFDGQDIIILLGNLCDNAVEALQKENYKQLIIGIKQNFNFCYIIIKNSISTSVIENNPKLQSNKNDQMFHGYGLQTVKKIAAKYKGEVSFTENDNMFVATVMLQIPNIT